MSKGQRIGALAIAAVIAVAAVLLLRPGSGEDDSTRQRSAAEPAPGQPQTTPSGDRPAAEGKPEYTLIRMRDGKPVGGVEELSVTEGEQVLLAFRSNTAGEIHVHGYDKYVDLKPNKVARVRFKANLDGIYEIEDHGTANQVAELRVNPS